MVTLIFDPSLTKSVLKLMHKDYAIYTPWLQALARFGLTYTIAAVGAALSIGLS